MADRSSIPDRIILEGMQFYGFHGVNAEERAMGQSYIVDLTVEMDLSGPGASDRLEDTVSYAHLYRAVEEVVEGRSRNLLESTALGIAEKILAEFPVNGVHVRVKKPRPPIRGSVIENASVEISRTSK